MRLQRTSKTISNVITIDDFKAYANISGDSRDREIASMLLTAITTIEDIADVSLTNQTIKLYSEKAVYQQRLYLAPVKSITSVKDYTTSVALDYTTVSDYEYVNLSEKRDIVIEYTTEPTVMGINLYRHFVFEYCAALFDGKTDNRYIDQILSKVPKRL